MAESLKQKRTSIKRSLTRFHSYFTPVSLADIETVNLIELQRRFDNILPTLNSYEQVQEQIELLDADFEANIAVYEEERKGFENQYYSVVSSVETFLKSQQPQVTNNATPSCFGSQTNNTSNARLPKLNLPKFNGDYDQWLFFKDSFNSLIHSNNTISNVDKFQYLRLSLVDSAKDAIESLEISDDNYPIAWNLINERFENKQVLVSKHIRDLFNIPAARTECRDSLKKILNSMEKHLRALRALKLPTEHWDSMVIHLISGKLDATTLREWECIKPAGELPTRTELKEFLLERIRMLDAVKRQTPVTAKAPQPQHSYRNHSLVVTSANTNKNCPVCNQAGHTIYQCVQFKALNPPERLNRAKQSNLCINCLTPNHSTSQCRSIGCHKCGKKHHSFLHFWPGPRNNSDLSNNGPSPGNEPVASTSASFTLNIDNPTSALPYVLLSTAIVTAFDCQNKPFKCRVLLDSGSQSNIITEKFCKALRLSTNETNISISGIAQIGSAVKQQTNITLQSLANAFSTNISCLVLPEITGNIPAAALGQRSFKIPHNITLADPTFDQASSIDILLGAGTFWDLITVGQIKLGDSQPILQKTKFGWIIAGPTTYNLSHEPVCNLTVTSDLNAQLTKFWELENYKTNNFTSEHESIIEDHYKLTTTTDDEGRFIVKMPLKESESVLGNSIISAKNRFLAIEKKLEKYPDLKQQYIDFIDDYIALGHMTLTTDKSESGFYLPHHCVHKGTSTTTKLRVVFDGSAKTTTGHSLNDILMVGPTIQQDLFSIIMRFRKHNVIISGDIKQMYRQILVHPEQRHLQKILWRSNKQDGIKTYQLNTVTYGLASSAFLAIRSLHEAAHRNTAADRNTTNAIFNDFYVDDLLTGCQTIDEALKLKSDITTALHKHGFPLHKWISNKPELQNCDTSILKFGESAATRTLGVIWNSLADSLQYVITDPTLATKITKRSILSNIAQIFDPLGLLSPVTITAKILIQKLWKLQISWDESIPQDLHTIWSNYRTQLMTLNTISFPRQVTSPNANSHEIHGFSDASESAYGACIYIRSLDAQTNYSAKLLCAKTRVAPLKEATIPRLELCGALLLAELMERVKNAMAITFTNEYFWCDSKIVLSWINTCPSRLKTFVANRVSQIQTLSEPTSWRYINTLSNPSDLLTRGITPYELIQSKLWFNGPNWLTLPEGNWPAVPDIHTDAACTEQRPISLHTTNIPNDFINSTKFSSLLRLQRTVAYMLRFITNARSIHAERNTGPLLQNELAHALIYLIRAEQKQDFSHEFNALSKARALPSNSKLLKLNPFLDEHKIIRVGGRIRNSEFSFDKKHPTLLSSSSHLAKLIGRYEHARTLHSGPQALLASIRDKFWPLSGRSFARSIVHNCVTCFKTKPRGNTYLMGNLPAQRIAPTRPFLTSGVDYAGPFLLKDRTTRNYKTIKAYIALFVCFATKAIHLELVSDLTTQCFLAALRRFFARRGICLKLFSDNGTTFIGANNDIQTFLDKHKNELIDTLSVDNVQWSFIPPRAPHFGGLWEAGVKLVKSHLKRVISDTPLTFEEFYTVLTQIEACVNSRPICPIYDDPNDLSTLTPGHFLIGEPLTSLPDSNLCDVRENRLSRFQRLQQMVQHFWSRWNKEYISTLQQRSKWHQPKQQSLKQGSLVIIKEDGLPPLKWRIGRVIETHPGKDDVIRVATIKTSTGTFKRPVIKLCVLPNQDVV